MNDRVKIDSPEAFVKAVKKLEKHKQKVDDGLYIICTPEYEQVVKEALKAARQKIRAARQKIRCPKCSGMLVHSMESIKCNKCGWMPEK